MKFYFIVILMALCSYSHAQQSRKDSVQAAFNKKLKNFDSTLFNLRFSLVGKVMPFEDGEMYFENTDSTVQLGFQFWMNYESLNKAFVFHLKRMVECVGPITCEYILQGRADMHNESKILITQVEDTLKRPYIGHRFHTYDLDCDNNSISLENKAIALGFITGRLFFYSIDMEQNKKTIVFTTPDAKPYINPGYMRSDFDDFFALLVYDYVLNRDKKFSKIIIKYPHREKVYKADKTLFDFLKDPVYKDFLAPVGGLPTLNRLIR